MRKTTTAEKWSALLTRKKVSALKKAGFHVTDSSPGHIRGIFELAGGFVVQLEVPPCHTADVVSSALSALYFAGLRAGRQEVINPVQLVLRAVEAGAGIPEAKGGRT